MTAGGCLLLLLIAGNHLNLIAFMLSIALFSTGTGLVFINAFAFAVGVAFNSVSSIVGVTGMAGMIYPLLQDGVACISSHIIALNAITIYFF